MVLHTYDTFLRLVLVNKIISMNERKHMLIKVFPVPKHHGLFLTHFKAEVLDEHVTLLSWMDLLSFSTVLTSGSYSGLQRNAFNPAVVQLMSEGHAYSTLCFTDAFVFNMDSVYFLFLLNFTGTK
jgi:hypothetical protein